MNGTETGNRNGPHLDLQNQACLWRLALMVALTFLFASTAPQGLVLASFSTLAFLGAAGLAVLASVLGEHPLGDSLTRWDEAAALMLISIASAWLVDRDQVTAIVNALPTN